MARKYIERSKYSADPAAITFTLLNGAGNPDRDHPPVSVALDSFPPSIIAHAAWHGLSQKIGDCASGAGGDRAVARQALVDMILQLQGGDWNATGESRAADTLTLQGLARGYGISAADAQVIWAKLSDAQRRDARAKDARLLSGIAAIMQERANAATTQGGTAPLDLESLVAAMQAQAAQAAAPAESPDDAQAEPATE